MPAFFTDKPVRPQISSHKLTQTAPPSREARRRRTRALEIVFVKCHPHSGLQGLSNARATITALIVSARYSLT